MARWKAEGKLKDQESANYVKKQLKDLSLKVQTKSNLYSSAVKST